MKAKIRFCFGLCVTFIIFVSFKILQPELQANSQEWDNLPVPDIPVNDQQNGKSGETKVELMIKKYISQYDFDWDSKSEVNIWDLAAGWLNNRTIHPKITPQLGAILNHMSQAKIIHADVGYGGSQLKLTLMLEGNQRVVFKPKWYDRDYVVEGKPYDGRDRHNAEVLAFHLNRMLGYNRTPLVVGRTIDLSKEILPVAEPRLLKTFFHRDTNLCFYGKCLYCKSEKDGVCAEGNTLEGSLILWLRHNVKFDKWKHPWRRTYRDGKYMRWEVDNTYCDYVRTVWPYNAGPRLMDILDAAVFDYLIGNADRHHYETFRGNNDSMLVMLDNAKSLGNPYEDEKSILAPLYQCCQLRHSTWTRLTELTDGVLTTVLDQILSKDPIAPVVAKQHYLAMDRRLGHIIDMVQNCIKLKGEAFVLIKDIYSSGIS